MSEAVLKSVSAENFASFANRICFTTEADQSKKEHLNCTFAVGDKLFNKVSFLFGANGSGKTFFCKIIREIQRLLEFSPLIAMNSLEFLPIPLLKGLDAPVRTFAFDIAYQKLPTSFAIEVILGETTYSYSFKILGKTVLSERLLKKKHRTEVLFDRTSPSFDDILLRSDFRTFESAKHCVKAEALCLPVAAFLNVPLAEKLVNAIRSIQVVNMASPKIPPSTKDAYSNERISKYAKIIQNADPTLRKFNISVKEEETSRQRSSCDDFENRELITTKTTVGVQSIHAVYDAGQETDGSPIAFFEEESLGTVKLFTTIPYLFDILENGGIFVVDEIENGLHLSLVQEIIQLFTNDETNPHHAQLICTSHQPLLLSEETRRDQVWVSHKDTHGMCELHRLSELKTSRAKVNLCNQILKGAFGCNPDSFFGKNIFE